MSVGHQGDWNNEASRLWRVARLQNWTQGPMMVRFGWRSPDPTTRRRLESHLTALEMVQLGSEEDYEPECDPGELIVDVKARRLSQTEFKAQVSWGIGIAEQFGVEMSRLGLNPGAPAA